MDNLSLQRLSTGAPPHASDWNAWEERLFALTDEIEGREGVCIEYAYRLAQMRLGMLPREPVAIVPPEEPDVLNELPF